MITIDLFHTSLPLLPADAPTILAHQAYLLSGADTQVQRWEAGCIITQALEQHQLVLQRFIITLHQSTKLYCTPPAGKLLLVYAAKGDMPDNTIEGCGKIAFQEQDMRMVYLPAHTTHFSHFSAGQYVLQVLTLDVVSQWPSEDTATTYRHMIAAFTDAAPQGLVLGNVPADAGMRTLLANLFVTRQPKQLLQRLLCLYAAALQQRRDKDDYNELDEARARATKKLIDTSPEKKHSLQELRAHFNLSGHTLNKAFRNIFWQSIGNYVIEVRLLYARMLLQEANRLYSKEAANILQWDPVHFSKQFGRRFSLSPVAFVKNRSV